jgi:hypothetical protein
MRKYFSKILLGAVGIICWFLMPQIVGAQFPSFEYYSEHAYPDASNFSAVDTYTSVVFTATVTDISGVNSVNAIIEDANGNQIGDWERMYDDGYHEDMLAGDNIYGAFFSLDGLDVNGTYYLTLRTTDNLYNSSYVKNPDGSYTEVYERVTTVLMRPVYCNPELESASPRLCIKIDITNPPSISAFTVTPNSIEDPQAVTLTTTLSVALAGQLITFKDLSTGQIIGYGFTDSSGSVSVGYVPAQTATLQTVYMGDALRKIPPSYKEANVTVANAGSCQTSGLVILCLAPIGPSNPDTLESLTTNVSGNIVAGQEVTFTATMSRSTARAGQTIYFRDNDTNVLLGSAVTDSIGHAIFTYRPAFAATQGHRIDAIYSGNPLLGLAPSYKSVMLYVTGSCADSNSASLCIEPTTSNPNTISLFTLSATNNEMMLSEYVTMTATLSTPTAGQTIYFVDRYTNVTIGTAVTNSSGVATLTYQPVFTGPHVLEALYLGNYLLDMKPSFKQQTLTITNEGYCYISGLVLLCEEGLPMWTQATMTFVLDDYDVTAEDTITLTATMSAPLAGINITFSDSTSGVTIGTRQTNSQGVASITYQIPTTTTTSTHVMRAVNGSNAQTLNQNLNITALPLIGSLVLAPTSITAGEPVLMTATMAPAMQNVSVTFYDDTAGTTIGTATTNSSGVATLVYDTPLSLVNGNHTIRAQRNDSLREGTAVLLVSAVCQVSGSVTLCLQGPPAIGNQNTVSSLNLSSNNINISEWVTMTATLSTPIPGQTIYFIDRNASQIGTAVTNSDGIATYSFQPAFTGPHTIEALYNGSYLYGLAPSYKQQTLTVNANANCQISGSTLLCITTTPAINNSTMATSLSVPSVQAEGTVTVIAQMSTALPGIMITFRDVTDNRALGTVPTNSSGRASVNYTIPTGTASGTHTITAVNASNGETDTVYLEISDLPLIGSITLNPTTISAGESTIVTAVTAPVLANVSITFFDDTAGTTIGSATTNSSGVAVITYNTPLSLTNGNHTIRAQRNDSLREATATLVVSALCQNSNSATLCLQVPPTAGNQNILSLQLSQSTITIAEWVTMTAALSSPISGQTIYFMDRYNNTQIGTAITDSDGAVSYSFQPNFTGTHVIEATFNGNYMYDLAPSYSQQNLTVNANANCQISGSTMLCQSATPVINNSTMSFSLSVPSVQAEGTVTLIAQMSSSIAGSVITFSDTTSGVTIGTRQTDSTGRATIDYTIPSGTSTGTHVMRAVNANNGETKTVNLEISDLPLIGSLVLNPTSITAGESVTITAVMAPVLADVSVTFYDDTASTTIGTATTNSSGVAVVTYNTPTSLADGNHTIRAQRNDSLREATAVLAVSGLCLTSNSARLCLSSPVTASNPETISSFTLSSSTITLSDWVTLTAQLSSAVAGETITFIDRTTGTTWGTANTDSSGEAVFLFQPNYTGTRTIEAVYTGKYLLDLSPSYKQQSLTINAQDGCQINGATMLCIDPPEVGYPSVSEFSASPFFVEAGSQTTLTATLSIPIPYLTITFTDTTLSTTIGTAITNKSGTATINYVIPYDAPTGTRNLRASFLTASKTTTMQVLGPTIEGWPYRKSITISTANADETFTDFPLLVKITNDADIGTYSMASGDDIRFADASGNALPYERESWSGGGGNPASGIFWVKVPSISADNDTTIYVYYGNTNAQNVNSAKFVWESNYKAVFHFGSGSTFSALDSTANNNHATNVADVTAYSSGKVGSAGYFSGSNYLTVPNIPSLVSAQQFTVSAFVYPQTLVSTAWFSKGTAGSYTDNILFCLDGEPRYGVKNGLDNMAVAPAITTNSWYGMSVVFDGSQTGNANRLKIYQNATQQVADFIIDNYTVPATTSANTGLEYIGTHGVTSSSWRWLGYIDELRISSVARSSAYNKFMYNNINSATNELTFGLHSTP